MANRDDTIFRNALAFYGKITASLSHELNNAIAIINEHNGLLDDMLRGAGQGLPVDEKKLQRISSKVSMQLDKSKELIKRLNKFAHGSDKDIVELDLAEIVEAITVLARRLAGLKGRQLAFAGPESPIMIRNSPFFIQQAVFACLEMFITAAGEISVIEVLVEKADGRAGIVITGPAIEDNDLAASRKAELDPLMDRLNGALETGGEPGPKQSLSISLESIS